MQLPRLATSARGRPKAVKKERGPLEKVPTFLDRLYMERRINRRQMEDAVAFRRLATLVYPAMGAPSLPKTHFSPGSSQIREADFALWKQMTHQINLKSGRQGLQLLTQVLLENEHIESLVCDDSINLTSINAFRKALDAVGEISGWRELDLSEI